MNCPKRTITLLCLAISALLLQRAFAETGPGKEVTITVISGVKTVAIKGDTLTAKLRLNANTVNAGAIR